MPTGWIGVLVTTSSEEAELARELLKESGITCRLMRAGGVEYVEGVGPSGPISLEVRLEDRNAAFELLEENSI